VPVVLWVVDVPRGIRDARAFQLVVANDEDIAVKEDASE